MPASHDAPERASGGIDSSMSLLDDITSGAADPAYAAAARRRASDQHRGADRRRPPAVRILLLLTVCGALVGVAAGQARRSAPAADGVRRSLADDVRRLTHDSDVLAARADGLRTQVAVLRDRALGDGAVGRAAARRVSTLELVAGAVAVHGPGIVVSLDDARAVSSPTPARGGRAVDGRIFDRDLQEAANALWGAGAEAVAINGQRLTATTAIRSAGEAVLVDLRPLSPPYVLRAVGDPDALEPAFADSPAARRFRTWTSLYGIGFDVQRAARLDLAAAATPDLRVARPVPS